MVKNVDSLFCILRSYFFCVPIFTPTHLNLPFVPVFLILDSSPASSPPSGAVLVCYFTGTRFPPLRTFQHTRRAPWQSLLLLLLEPEPAKLSAVCGHVPEGPCRLSGQLPGANPPGQFRSCWYPSPGPHTQGSWGPLLTWICCPCWFCSTCLFLRLGWGWDGEIPSLRCHHHLARSLCGLS